MKKQKIAIILIFLVLIFGMTAFSMLSPAREFSDKENRTLAQMPAFSAETYFKGAFAKDYEAYITDQFVGRDWWIGAKTALERAVLKQESNGVYFAKDGYLIENHAGSFETDRAKENILCLAEFMREVAADYGEERVSALIVPNAVEVLKDKLPPYAPTGEEEAYLDQIAKELPQETWFDSSQVLEEHKTEEIYYKTDHHWKTLGAFYVYEAWAKEQGLEPLEMKDYEIETVTEDFKGTIESKVGGDVGADSIQIFKSKQEYDYTLLYNHRESKKDLYNWESLETKDKYGLFFGGNQPVVECTIENDSDRRLLVIKDSYAHCFLPFAFHDYGQVDFIDLRYFSESLREYREKGDYTDILFLYNASGFAEDPNVAKLRN